jgi:acetyl-CoA acetyltransferase
MQDLYVVGVGMTVFGRHPDRTVRELTEEAVGTALTDAGCARDRIQAAYFGNVAQDYFDGQLTIPGQVALLSSGFSGIPIYNVESACATGSMAFHLAARHARAGDGDLILAVGVEKMNYPDKAKVFALFDGGWDVERADENYASLITMGEGVDVPPEFKRDKPFSKFMEVYAAFCRFHMRHHGLTQQQLAAVAEKNHAHSRHNPYAQYRDVFTQEAIIESPPVAYPLTTLMCSPVSDGAAAAVLCTEQALDKYGFNRRRAVRIRASVMRSASHRAVDDSAHHITRLAAEQAYESAGLGPQDMDVAEVHDASAMGEIIQSENLGFCALGEGGELAESGATRIGGRIPINPSGGLECKGHPLGATGLGQIFELVTQLRGEADKRQVAGARLAIQENGGGLFGSEEASAHVGIFSVD